MEDRFNFNAIVTGYYDIDTPDEYAEFEPQIYLENVDIWSGGDIGISRDDLELAIKNQYPNLEKSQFNQIMKFFEDNSISSDNEAYLTILPDKIIQCTGLKDINGKLIYEGDIVRFKDNITINGSKTHISVIEHNEAFNAFMYHAECMGLYTVNKAQNEKFNVEVIGNIYQDSHLLDNSNIQ